MYQNWADELTRAHMDSPGNPLCCGSALRAGTLRNGLNELDGLIPTGLTQIYRRFIGCPAFWQEG
jgi:hypothetical protein